MMLQIVDLAVREVVQGLARRGRVGKDWGRLNGSVVLSGRQGTLEGQVIKVVGGCLRKMGE